MNFIIKSNNFNWRVSLFLKRKKNLIWSCHAKVRKAFLSVVSFPKLHVDLRKKVKTKGFFFWRQSKFTGCILDLLKMHINTNWFLFFNNILLKSIFVLTRVITHNRLTPNPSTQKYIENTFSFSFPPFEKAIYTLVLEMW